MSQSKPSDHTSVTEAAQHALEEANKRFTSCNPLSYKRHSDACSYLPGGNTRTVLHASPFPLCFNYASSCHLISLEGHTYTDFLGEYTAGIYGHNHPIIRFAIDAALDSGWSFGGTNLYEKQLAQIVCERFAPTIELVRFCNSGTEANMMAVAAAVAWTGRKKVLVFEKGYHGATLSFRAGSHASEKDSMKSVNLPHEWVIAPYDNMEATRGILGMLEPGTLATIIVEPMLGSGGGIPASKRFLQFLRDYATENGAVLIFDEVMTSRLGYHGLGYELDIKPDLMTLGKWVGGGMSFGAFGGRKDIMDMFDPRGGELAHAGTFNNNVVSMAAGIAGCKLLDEQRLAELNSLGNKMRSMVEAAIDKSLGPKHSALTEQSDGHDTASGVLEVPEAPSTNGQTNRDDHDHQARGKDMWISGLGSILVIHFSTSPIQSILQSLFYHHLLRRGLYISERGFIALSIEITPEHVEVFADATAEFVSHNRDLILTVFDEEQ